ncbi:hypothetical protein O3M35_010078 [Rhynocoris fuscipes]|uniref:CCR4-NOT transcription complex subunit 10 n=1 Tax=Rhynocoris fuscipes TaxID=488301 RepID=A0AAW1D4R0_9HEMI
MPCITTDYSFNCLNDEQKLVSTAHLEFSNKKYAACQQALSLLMVHKPGDFKVFHNKAVVDLYAAGHKNIDVFHKMLTNLLSQFQIKLSEDEPPNEIELCVLYYNFGIVYYYLKQYDNALNIINKVFTLIQPMEESLAHKVCLLLLELNIKCGQIDTALSHISFIENQFVYTSYNTNMVKLEKEDKQGGAQVFTTILLKAKLLWLRQRYKAALDTLIVLQEDIKSFSLLGDSKTMVYFNNIAVIYHYLQKPCLCSFFMSKAFSVYRNAVEKYQRQGSGSKECRPSLFEPEILPKLMYNRGIALLFTNRACQAFDCLTEAVQGMHKSPVAWLRLAESCIMFYKSGNEDAFNFMAKRKELVTGLVGVGSAKKIVLNNKLYQDTMYNTEPQSYAVPVPNLEFAMLCARNALALVSPTSDKLRHAILAVLSYINLTLGNPLMAYKYSKLLFEEASATPLYKYLSRLYLAESLVMLDRIQEAVEVLNPVHFKDCDPTSETLHTPWSPKTSVTAQATLYYNLAVVLAIRGDIHSSSEFLKHVWVSKGQKGEVPIHVIALALYNELILGRLDITRTIIKQNCPHVFPSVSK